MCAFTHRMSQSANALQYNTAVLVVLFCEKPCNGAADVWQFDGAMSVLHADHSSPSNASI